MYIYYNVQFNIRDNTLVILGIKGIIFQSNTAVKMKR